MTSLSKDTRCHQISCADRQIPPQQAQTNLNVRPNHSIAEKDVFSIREKRVEPVAESFTIDADSFSSCRILDE